jgi:hypothetical protein
VTLCRTYRRIRWSASVIRSLEAAEADSRGGISVSLLMHTVTLVSPMEIARAMTPSHSLGQVRPDRLTTIHYPCQLDPVMFKVETLLAAIRAVNWCQRIGRPRSAIPVEIDSHTLHCTRCCRVIKEVSDPQSRSLGWVGTDPHAEPILQVVHKAPAAFWLRRAGEGERTHGQTRPRLFRDRRWACHYGASHPITFWRRDRL